MSNQAKAIDLLRSLPGSAQLANSPALWDLAVSRIEAALSSPLPVYGESDSNELAEQVADLTRQLAQAKEINAKHVLNRIEIEGQFADLREQVAERGETLATVIASILDTCGWEINQDSGGCDGPVFRRNDWQTTTAPVVYAYTVMEILNAKLARPVWSKKPTKPGWYWWKRYRLPAVVVYVVSDGGPNVSQLEMHWIRNVIGEAGHAYVALADGEWCPIQPPQEGGEG